ncbi:MAG: arylamine N-acetyltransferase family protein [Steroidobacteraceae bacterium]
MTRSGHSPPRPAGLDLGAYFRRIGYEGPATSDLTTLRAILRRQVGSIPFENLDPVTGRPVRLDLSSLEAKLVRSRRGGYCFELNSLLRAALATLGFAVTGLAARVRWMTPPERPLGPRTHMLLRVELPEGTYLADAGFGGHLLDEPLRLEIDSEQRTPAARYQLTRRDGVFALSTRLSSGWQPMYQFDLEPQVPADYEMGSWFTSTHPGSWFTQRLLIERLTDHARHTLSNTRLVERCRDGTVSERNLSDPAQLADALERVFGLSSPVPATDLYARIAGA